MTFGAGELVFLGLVVMAAAWASTRRPAAAATLVLCLLLVHELILRWLDNWSGLAPAQITSASLWKDAALVGLLVGVSYRAWRKRLALKTRFAWRREDAWLAALGALGLLSAALSPNKIAAVAGLRDYFEPVGFYVAVRLMDLERRDLTRLLTAWLSMGAFMAVLAIWQSGWNPEQYAAWGFGTPSGQVGIPTGGVIGQAGLRPPSTVTGPNELAVHMLLMAVAAFLLVFETSGRVRLLCALALGLFGAGLVTTSSRSGFLGLLVGLAMASAFVLRRRRGDLALLLKRAWIGVAIALGAVAIIAGVVVFSGLGSLIGHTVTHLADQYHTLDSLEAVVFLSQHPQGVGMGLVGPRQGFGFPPVAAFHVEGSLFQMAMEFGVWGLAVFVVFLIVAGRRMWSNGQHAGDSWLRVVCGVGVAGWSGACVTFLFLPLMQAFPLMAWIWFLTGIGTHPLRPERTGSAPE